MTAVIRCLGLAGVRRGEGSPNAPIGAFLKSYDPDAHDGWGDAEFTRDLNEAMTFPDKHAAWLAWRTVSNVRPTRPDGRPNRPLTAFTVEILDTEEAKGEK